MGFNFPGTKKVNIGPHTSVSLTGEGAKKAEAEEPIGDFGNIIATLHFGNGCSYTVSELSERTGIPPGRVADIVRNNRTYIMIKSATD